MFYLFSCLFGSFFISILLHLFIYLSFSLFLHVLILCSFIPLFLYFFISFISLLIPLFLYLFIFFILSFLYFFISLFFISYLFNYFFMSLFLVFFIPLLLYLILYFFICIRYTTRCSQTGVTPWPSTTLSWQRPYRRRALESFKVRSSRQAASRVAARVRCASEFPRTRQSACKLLKKWENVVRQYFSKKVEIRNALILWQKLTYCSYDMSRCSNR